MMQRNKIQEQKPVSPDGENRMECGIAMQLEFARYGTEEGFKIYYKTTVYKAVIIKRRWLSTSK